MVILLKSLVKVENMKEVVVWDWPVRLLHWLMVVLFSGLILSGKVEGDYLEWHFYMGYSLSAVIIARILYGFLGSKHARFSNFFIGFKQITSYFFAVLKGNKETYIGHNPIGALMVVTLLLLLSIQWFTGLVSSDDIFWFGPLYEWFSSGWQEALSQWHYLLPDILLGLVALHIIAVLYYEIAFKERLIKAMITGKKWIVLKEVSESERLVGSDEIKIPKVGVLISLGISLCWLLWLYSLPI